MAVQSIDYELNSPRGENSGDKTTLTVLAKVVMDSGDGIVTALNASGLPAIGSPYDHFGETDPATLRSVTVNRVMKNTQSKSIVVLALNYIREKPGNDSGGQTPSGGPAEDPSEVQFVLTPGYRYLSVGIHSAQFIQYEDADGNVLTPTPDSLIFLNRGPISMSNGVPISPVPQHEIAVPTLTLERYYREWDQNWDDAVLSVNDAPFTVVYPDGEGEIVYVRTFDTRELLLQGIYATQRQFGAQLWYWCRFEFWIGDWDRVFLSEGILQRDVGLSTSRLKQILNDLGERVDEPVKLNIEGVELFEGDTPVFLRWRTRDEYDFDSLNLMVR